MAFQPVPDTAEFRIVHTSDSGVPIENVIHVRNTVNAWTQVHLNSVTSAIGNAWRDSVMPLLVDDVTLDKVLGRDIGVEFGLQSLADYNTPGSDIAEPMPFSVAALVKLVGAIGAPPRHGFLFISGLSIADVLDQELEVAFQVALNAAMGAVDGAIGGDAFSAWVIVSRFANKVKRAAGVTNVISARTTRSVPGAQRDRRPGA